MISVTRSFVFLSCVYAVVSLTIRHTIPEQTSTTTELDNGCKPEACETPRCIDPVILTCCPECPNGENCLIEGQKVSFNEPLVFPDGRLCYCVPESAGSSPTFYCEHSSSSPPPDEIVSDDVILFTSTSPEPNCMNSPIEENDPCAHCECKLKSGKWDWDCIWQDCMVPPCFDAYRPPGQCCSVCPNGPNCGVDGTIIPQGEFREVNGEMCFCNRGGYRQDVSCQPFSSTTKEIAWTTEETTRETTTLTTPDQDCRFTTKPNNGPCFDCTCELKSGQYSWNCFWYDCTIPPCVDAYRAPGACCYECPNGPNCQVDGVIIPEGDVRETYSGVCYCLRGGYRQEVNCEPPTTTPFDGCSMELKPTDKCTFCECDNWSGTRKWECYSATCSEPPCVDAVYDECCPRCPNGPNCGIDGLIIPYGEERVTSDGQVCFCGGFSPYRQRNLELTCRPITTTPDPNCYVGNVIIPEGDARETDSGMCYCLRGGSNPEINCEPLSTLPPTTPFNGCAPENKPYEKCGFCDCGEWTDWTWQCFHPTCMEPPCVDPDYNECCPTCPNGPNCEVDGIVIPYGESRDTPNGQSCFCGGDDPYRKGNLEIICQPFSTTPDNAYCDVEGVLIGVGEFHEKDNGALCYCDYSLVANCNFSVHTTPTPWTTTTPEGCDPNRKPAENACTQCECSENQWICKVADCRPPPCVDSYTPAGECCSVCPNGPNCREGGVIIPMNTILPVNSSSECQCVQNNIWESPVAVCRSISTTAASTTTTTTPKLIFISKGTTSKPSSTKPTTKTTTKPTTKTTTKPTTKTTTKPTTKTTTKPTTKTTTKPTTKTTTKPTAKPITKKPVV